MTALITDYWVTVGLAATIGAFTGATVSVWSVTRNIAHKSVIDERQKWRELLRELIPALVTCKSRTQRTRFRDSIVLRLNPNDDQEAVELLDKFLRHPSRENGEQVVTHFQTILKFDWERAKIEASLRNYRSSQRAAKIIAKQSREKTEF